MIGVEAGELVCVHLHAMGNSAILTPGGFAATLGGVAMTGGGGTATTGSGVFPGSRRLSLLAGVSGNLALAVDLGVSCRTALAVITRLKGFDAATPFGQQFVPSQLSSNTGAQAVPPGGLTTGRNGNVYLVSVNVKGGDTTGMVMTGVDGFAVATTGGDATKHIAVAYGWVKTAPAATINPAASWTTANRCAGLGTEVNA